MAIIEMEIPNVIAPQVLSALNEATVARIVGNLADAARNHWLGLAQRYLHTSRADYMRSIQQVQLLPGVAVISLVGQPANMIENGSDIVDLRDWLLGEHVPTAPLGGRGKHPTADGDGFYRAIPFRHQAPGSAGTAAPAMGSAYRGHVAGAEEIGRRVYQAAKKLRPAKMATGRSGVVQAGQRLQAGLAPLLRPHHKTDIYAGMVRQEAAYKSKVQATYSTFRTISTRVPEGWIRPPTAPRRFAEQTSRWVTRMAPLAFEAYMRGINKATLRDR